MSLRGVAMDVYDGGLWGCSTPCFSDFVEARSRARPQTEGSERERDVESRQGVGVCYYLARVKERAQTEVRKVSVSSADLILPTS